MTEIRRADPGARRRVLASTLAGVLGGGIAIALLQHYRAPLLDWLVSESERYAHRLRLVFILVAVLVASPLLGLAAFLWQLGARAVRAAEFPPPGCRVVGNTVVAKGKRALRRG